MHPLVFKAIQAAVIITYVAVGSDFARRKGTKPLVAPVLSSLMMTTYLALVGVYLYTLYTLDTVLTLDLVGLAFTVLGTGLYIKAKRDLAHRFTYVGYAFENITVMREGVYGYIRHPIYTASYLFTLGALCTCGARISQLPVPMVAAALVGVVYIYGIFIPLLASRESRNLREQLGENVETYQRRVHAFIPFLRS